MARGTGKLAQPDLFAHGGDPQGLFRQLRKVCVLAGSLQAAQSKGQIFKNPCRDVFSRAAPGPCSKFAQWPGVEIEQPATIKKRHGRM